MGLAHVPPARGPQDRRTMFKRLLPAILLLASPVLAAVSYYQGPTVAETAFEADRIARGLTLGSIADFTGLTSASSITHVATDVNFSVSSDLITTDGGTATLFGTATIVLPANVYALGIYLSRPVPGSFGNSTLNYAEGSFPLLFDTPVFFGVISEEPLTSISPVILTPSNGLKIHSFFIGTQSEDEEEDPGSETPPIGEVPEPATAALLSGSLLAMAIMARRRKQAQAPRPTAEP